MHEKQEQLYWNLMAEQTTAKNQELMEKRRFKILNNLQNLSYKDVNYNK